MRVHSSLDAGLSARRSCLWRVIGPIGPMSPIGPIGYNPPMPPTRLLAIACLLIAVRVHAAEPALIAGPRPVTTRDGNFRFIGGDFTGDGKRDFLGLPREVTAVYPGRGD